jgi:hypothetical protein
MSLTLPDKSVLVDRISLKILQSLDGDDDAKVLVAMASADVEAWPYFAPAYVRPDDSIPDYAVLPDSVIPIYARLCIYWLYTQHPDLLIAPLGGKHPYERVHDAQIKLIQDGVKAALADPNINPFPGLRLKSEDVTAALSSGTFIVDEPIFSRPGNPFESGGGVS